MTRRGSPRLTPLLLMAASLCSSVAPAQPAVAAGITVGGGPVLSGAPSDGGGLSAEIAASFRLHQRPGWAPSATIAREWYGTSGDQACFVPCPIRVGRRHLVHASVGMEWWSTGRWFMRSSGGPGYWSRGQSDGWHAGSWQLRLDAASPPLGFISLIASTRLTALDDITVLSVGAGAVLRAPPSRSRR